MHQTTTTLAEFLRRDQPDIVREWTGRMRALSPARELSDAAIRDHLPAILSRMAELVDAERIATGTSLGASPEQHALDRLGRGFDLDEILTEYGLLRQSILDLWESRVGSSLDLGELRALDSAFDEALRRALRRHASIRERLLKALDRISDSALGSEAPDSVIQQLLHAMIESTESVDTAAVFLREGNVLRVRAAVGLETGVEQAFTISGREGAAGRVAADREPMIVRDAARTPEVVSPTFRDHHVRALYAVPLLHDGDLVGVAHIGSVTAFEFSDEDKLLFRTMAARATTIVVQAQLLTHLREADRRKDEFLAILAHELRNPLAPIRTAVAILRADGISESLRERSRDIIDRQVSQMTRLIDDLLDVSRLSRGKMNLQRRPVLLDQVLDDAIETARPTIDQHRHRLTQHRGRSAICLDGDLARLSQVFANLLNNAAKYTPDGGTLSIAVDEHPASVDVRVTDTGDGIDADHLDSIFDLFAQGSGSTSSTVGGLGIGLALARKLAELHGGTLTASSPGPGRGSTFTVTLPTVQVTARPSDARDRRAVVMTHLGRRVLVVDDSVDAAETVATLLQAAGCVTRAVHSGEQAVTSTVEFTPEIVLLDVGLPGVDGLEVCRRIRTLPGGQSVYVVAITGWGQDDDRRKTRDAGFDAHLVKPVDSDALLRLVEHAPRVGQAPI